MLPPSLNVSLNFTRAMQILFLQVRSCTTSASWTNSRNVQAQGSRRRAAWSGMSSSACNMYRNTRSRYTGWIQRSCMTCSLLSSHTTERWPSAPVCPATVEALIVRQADMAEARLTEFLDHCQRTCGADGWTSYSMAFGGQLRTP